MAEMWGGQLEVEVVDINYPDQVSALLYTPGSAKVRHVVRQGGGQE